MGKNDYREKIDILILEDDLLIGSLLHKFLSKKNHRTVLCRSLSDALTAITSHRFDLILSDLHLPDGFGTDLLKELKQESTFFVLMTTERQVEKVKEIALVDVFLPKPFHLQEIEEIVDGIQNK